eukprot:TRINITY_DN28705_c0_g1_i1.p1 TRINITY_DN28705_c0_g1~~TRINITY_DN28705_c0_g1_i1.p1  ORF type:complete len:457 (+),score=40.44 TRINITY_DN28705_c0_g1_i1:72-1442(+)
MGIPPVCGGHREAFDSGLAELQMRCDVLHEVLLASGLMRPQEMEMHLHRRRFDAVRRIHPGDFKQSLSDTVASTNVASDVEKFMHLSTIHTVRSVSQSFRSNFANRTRPVDLGKLYWCSSTEPFGQTSQLWQSYDFSSSKWNTLPCPSDLPRPRYVVGGFGSVYLCGEHSIWHRYDAVADDWHLLPPMPSGRLNCDGASFFVISGNLYVSGVARSRVAVGPMERFDPRKNVWEALPRYTKLQVQFAMSVVSDKLYVCGGGIGGSMGLMSQLECYNAEANVWEQLPGMTSCSGACAAIGLAGSLYVVGGSRLDDTVPFDGLSFGKTVGLDIAECYRPSEQVWLALPPLRQRRQSPSLATSRGCLYVSSMASSLECFDPALDRWEEVRLNPALSSWEDAERRASVDFLRGSLIIGSAYVFGEPLGADFRRIVRFNRTTRRWEDIGVKTGIGAFANHVG